MLSHPTRTDMAIANAAASDSVAQRWLGWLPELVVPENRRATLLAKGPGRGLPWANTEQWFLIAIERASGRIVGAVGIIKQRQEVGGWLAPAFRARGLGRELFHGAVTFAHHHLGLATVRAGAEITNSASIGALTSAGFIPTTGPDWHQLPDGRVVPTQWFRHDTERPTTCR
ncbi:GNAT family N-acetyltransferase [Amycolatopsis taiwanensis]